MQHPELTMLIHDAMMLDRRRQSVLETHQDIPGSLSTVRALVGNALIAIGTRIVPAPRPTVASATPVLTMPAPIRSGK